MNKYLAWYEYDGSAYTVYAHPISSHIIGYFGNKVVVSGCDSALGAAKFYAESEALDESIDDVTYVVSERIR